jgi:hypothetical protein
MEDDKTKGHSNEAAGMGRSSMGCSGRLVYWVEF